MVNILVLVLLISSTLIITILTLVLKSITKALAFAIDLVIINSLDLFSKTL